MNGLADLVAALCREPFGLTPAEAGRLTPRQARFLVERAADAHRDAPRADGPPSLGPRDLFDYWCKANKVPAWLAAKLWRERRSDGQQQ